MMKDKEELKPVFITGMPRSGTTLLYRTLLKHPSFKPESLCLEETRIFVKPHTAILSNSIPKPLKSYMLDDELHYQNYLKSITYILSWQNFCKKIRLSRLVRSKFTYWKLLLNSRVIRSYFQHAKHARGCERIVEKTPRHLLFTDRIHSTFPYSKIIIMLRHPVDVYASYVKRKKVDQNSSWLDVNIDTFVKKYQKMASVTEKLTNNNMAISLKYEDFVRDPKPMFETICNYINEPYIQELLNEGEPELNDYKIDPLLAKPITNKSRDWSEHVTKQEAVKIEAKLNDEMELFEYESKVQN